MYRNVMIEMFPDRKVTYPSEILTNYVTQIRNPVRCCTIPGQNGSDNNDGQGVIPLFPNQIHQLHRGPMIACNAWHWNN